MVRTESQRSGLGECPQLDTPKVVPESKVIVIQSKLKKQKESQSKLTPKGSRKQRVNKAQSGKKMK